MIFDRNRVIDSLCYDLEQWIGWKGYASDNLKLLKEYVEEGAEGAMTEIMRITNGEHCPFVDKGASWQFFYPVNPPKHKDELVPFDTCQELIDWFRGRVGIEASDIVQPLIWVRQQGIDMMYLITEYDFESQKCTAGGIVFSMHELTTNFTLLDGTPIGKEIEK